MPLSSQNNVTVLQKKQENNIISFVKFKKPWLVWTWKFYWTWLTEFVCILQMNCISNQTEIKCSSGLPFAANWIKTFIISSALKPTTFVRWQSNVFRSSQSHPFTKLLLSFFTSRELHCSKNHKNNFITSSNRGRHALIFW